MPLANPSKSSTIFALTWQRKCTGVVYPITSPIIGQLAYEELAKGFKQIKGGYIIWMPKWSYILNLKKDPSTTITPQTRGKFHRTSEIHDYNLRGSNYHLQLPLPKTNFLKRSFSYRGAMAWNQLSNETREMGDLTSFKLAIS